MCNFVIALATNTLASYFPFLFIKQTLNFPTFNDNRWIFVLPCVLHQWNEQMELHKAALQKILAK
jgi:hypothetical protein